MNSTMKKAAIGGMLFGGTLGGASAANASIVNWNCNIAFHASDYYGMYVDVINQQVSDGTTSLPSHALWFFGGSSTLTISGNTSVDTFLGQSTVRAPAPSNSGGTANLALGSLVSGASSWALPSLGINRIDAGYAWTNALGNTTNYIGFRMKSATGGTLYGWAKVELSPGSNRNGTVTQIAYEDSGAGINVGAVPAPGALALLGLAGLAARRRRA